MVWSTILALFPPLADYFKDKENRKRPRILEMAKFIVCPSIGALEKDIKYLTAEKYWMVTETSDHPSNIERICQVPQHPRLKDDFYRQYPKIKEKSEKWLKEYDALTTKLREIFSLILADQDFVTITSGYADKNYIPSYVIDNLDSLPTTYLCKDFWSINSSHLLKLREKEGIRNKFDELKEINTNLLAHSNEILQEFERIRKTEKEKYDFTEEELKEPSDYSVPRGSNIL